MLKQTKPAVIEDGWTQPATDRLWHDGDRYVNSREIVSVYAVGIILVQVTCAWTDATARVNRRADGSLIRELLTDGTGYAETINTRTDDEPITDERITAIVQAQVVEFLKTIPGEEFAAARAVVQAPPEDPSGDPALDHLNDAAPA